jgi:PAS domain S-box-containing protein
MYSERDSADRLVDSAQVLLLAIEGAGIGIFEVDFADGVAIRFTPAARKIFGFAREVPLTLAMVDALVHADDRAEREKAHAAAVDHTGDGVYRTTYRIRRADDGAFRWIGAHGQAFFQGGRVVRLVGVHRDMTDELNATQIRDEKAALAEQLSALARALPGAIYTYREREDGSSHMPYGSPNIEDVIGFSPEALAQDLAPIAGRIYVDDIKPFCAAIARSTETASPCRTTFRYDHPQKGLAWIQSESAPQVFDDGKVLWHGYLQDVTRRKNAEAALEASEGRLRTEFDGAADERLATLESMAAGLAHEVNQPLAAGATFLKVARRMLDARGGAAREGPAAEVLRLLDKASAQILRAGRIITRVREFSTRGEPDKTYQNLHQLIAGVGKALSEDEKLSNFQLMLRLNAENDRVIVDRMQISQVLVNLIRNAAQAMHAAPTQDIIVATSLDDTCEIRVQVIDRGVGLSEETHKSLFKPVRTSKPSGMGVGLSISRAIIEAHYGKIWAEPNPGGGAIFSFSLPLAEQELP